MLVALTFGHGSLTFAGGRPSRPRQPVPQRQRESAGRQTGADRRRLRHHASGGEKHVDPERQGREDNSRPGFGLRAAAYLPRWIARTERLATNSTKTGLAVIKKFVEFVKFVASLSGLEVPPETEKV